MAVPAPRPRRCCARVVMSGGSSGGGGGATAPTVHTTARTATQFVDPATGDLIERVVKERSDGASVTEITNLTTGSPLTEAAFTALQAQPYSPEFTPTFERSGQLSEGSYTMASIMPAGASKLIGYTFTLASGTATFVTSGSSIPILPSSPLVMSQNGLSSYGDFSLIVGVGTSVSFHCRAIA